MIILEKYVYAALLSSCIFLERTSVISLSVFLLVFGIIAGIAAGRVFLFHKYEVFYLFRKDGLLSENGKIVILCSSVLIYLLALSFIAIGSWMFFQ
ncbi:MULTISPECIES: porin [Enterococcus]|uniref:porin n=1 Tax=Enterococcus TaxID=1350 RepID=UPI000A3414F0|nr:MULTISPECIES: porin [Enterococcus]AXG40645.1 porin [Enterococcus gilvus]MDU5511975.1 porin [Enterococcus gilvus]